MSEIEFKTDEMLGFYSLWVDALISPSEDRDKVLSAFENPDIKELVNATPNSFNGLSKTLGKFEQKILNGEVSNIDGFMDLIVQTFENNGAENIEPALRKSFGAYHEFCEKKETKDIIDGNLSAVKNFQKNEKIGYAKELDNLYVFFDVPADNKCVCYLNPYPDKPFNDGSAMDGFFKQNFVVKRLEEDSAYLENSTILMRKTSTPLHEASHFLFGKSEIKQDFWGGKGEGVGKLRKVLTQQLEKYPDKRGENATFDEALASCSSAIMTEKRQGKLADNHEWYHGFEAANELAPHVYPLYKEYLSQGKKMDDAFFGRLADNVVNFEKEKSKPDHAASNVSDYLNLVRNRLAPGNKSEQSVKKINPSELKVDWSRMAQDISKKNKIH